MEPESLCHRVSSSLHIGHQGLDTMLRRARQTVYWPGIEGDLQFQRLTCEACNTHIPSQSPEALVLTPVPDYPFQMTVADLLQENGHTYMAYANRLTGYSDVSHFPTEATSNKQKAQFRKYFVK